MGQQGGPGPLVRPSGGASRAGQLASRLLRQTLRALAAALATLYLLAGPSAVVAGGASARSVASWPYPNHDLSNSRAATGTTIRAANVSRLTPGWAAPMQIGLSTSPVIVDGSVFVEDQTAEVARIDLASGAVLWKSRPNGFSIGPYGVAVGRDKVFATTSTSLFALSGSSGALLWTTPLTHTPGEGVDVQPQLIGSRIIVSSVPVGGSGEIYAGGARGYVDAVDPADGKLLWSFDTVASPSLWGNPSVNSGGGAWYPPSYSPALGLLYVGTANPAPFVGAARYPNGSSRPGRNLYTDSTVALSLHTGRLAWYHQDTRHDIFDRDFVHTMLVRLPVVADRSPRSVVVGTGKSGDVVGMNPATGRVLWTVRIGLHLNDRLRALSGPTEVLPGTFGGVLTPPAWSRGRVVVATLNAPDTLSPDQTAYFGGKTGTMPGEVVALNGRTGRVLWDTKIDGDPTGGVTIVNDLAFTATLQGSVLALSMSTGRVVWQTAAPGGINGWMSIVGRHLVVPVGLARPAEVWTLELPAKAGRNHVACGGSRVVRADCHRNGSPPPSRSC